MITPQEIQEARFEKVRRGYDMDAVDDFLERVMADYVELYKENSVLKSKMRILVEKLEEYREQENSMQSAIMAAQKTGEQMTIDAEKKCAAMLREAEKVILEKTKGVETQAHVEEKRLQAAKLASARFIDGIERQLQRQIEMLEDLRRREMLPEATPVEEVVDESSAPFDFDKEPSAPTMEERADALIEEIGQNIEQTIGGPAEASETPETPAHFKELKFGSNYNHN